MKQPLFLRYWVPENAWSETKLRQHSYYNNGWGRWVGGYQSQSLIQWETFIEHNNHKIIVLHLSKQAPSPLKQSWGLLCSPVTVLQFFGVPRPLPGVKLSTLPGSSNVYFAVLKQLMVTFNCMAAVIGLLPDDILKCILNISQISVYKVHLVQVCSDTKKWQVNSSLKTKYISIDAASFQAAHAVKGLLDWGYPNYMYM